VDTRRFVLNSPAVIGESIDGEVMVINLVNGIYYNLAGTAAAVWPLLTAGVPIQLIIDHVAQASAADPATIATDLAAFADQLLAEAIVRVVDEAQPVSSMPVMAAATYTGFALNRYDDMRALLVVDPVHEVGDFGWPSEPGSPRTSQ
jgi:Coenzyme PQQ synthesis protein D (PqqD)